MTILARVAALGMILGAAAAPAPIRTQIVSYTSGFENVHAYLALPPNPTKAMRSAQSGRRPAIIVIHGDHGLDDWTEDQARTLAARGYVVLAVDLYRGEVAHNTEQAHEMMRGLPDDRALRDVAAAYAYLAARPDVRDTSIGVIGWNMGGWYALQLAIHHPHLAACAVNDSALPTDGADIARIRAPVLGNFGADDRGIPPAALNEFQKAMQAAGESVDLKAYPGASDGFDEPTDSDHYRPDAAADAWNRTLAFFAKTLGP